jgi:hypothetical protein
MHSPSIEFFHAKIEKLIRLARSYTEIEGLDFIIKACRLKPYHYVYGEQNHKVVLQRWWFDEFGNSLNITKHKKISLTFNDLSLNDKIVCTDLYYGLSLDRIVKMSKLMYLCAGKDEDLYQDCYLLSLLGVDDHLRTYLYWYGEWQQVSSLLLGVKHLKLLAKNADTRYFRQLAGPQDTSIPCLSGWTWLSYLPASRDFLDIIKEQHETLLPIFGDT